KVGAPWLSRSVVSGNERQISRSCSRSPIDRSVAPRPFRYRRRATGTRDVQLEKIRVLSHCGNADQLGVPPELRDRVELVEIPRTGAIPAGATGDALVTKRRVENLYEAAALVPWVHIIGTGVDNLDIPRLSRTSVVTNAKGAAGIPIAEWTLATMLAFEK